MASPPLILSDNWFDNVVLHPTFVLSNPDDDDVAGSEAFHIADNLRDMTLWTPSATNAVRKVRVIRDSNATPNCLVLDRGSAAALAGKTIRLQSSTDSFATVTTDEVVCTIPSSTGTLASSSNGCLTAGGVWWKTFTISNSRAAWQLSVDAMGAGLAPVITGASLGVAYRFPSYCFLDAGTAADYGCTITYLKNDLSRGGLRVKTRPLVFAKLVMKFAMEDTDYPAFDTEVQRQLTFGAPLWVSVDETSTAKLGEMRLFQVPGEITYDPASSPLHREVELDLEEVLPAVVV